MLNVCRRGNRGCATRSGRGIADDPIGLGPGGGTLNSRFLGHAGSSGVHHGLTTVCPASMVSTSMQSDGIVDTMAPTAGPATASYQKAHSSYQP
jgi:hypothetical protein